MCFYWFKPGSTQIGKFLEEKGKCEPFSQNGNLPFITRELEQMVLLSIGNFEGFVHSVVNAHYIAILCTFTSKRIIYHLSDSFIYAEVFLYSILHPTGVICFQVLSIKFCTLLD